MVDVREFIARTRLDRQMVEAWREAGWLRPRDLDGRTYSDIDIARAQLICDLRNDLGVNDEGVSVILDLLDQLHGVRRVLRDVLDALRGEREATRLRLMALIGKPRKTGPSET
jgi:chaperone modulatory protein CbpM